MSSVASKIPGVLECRKIWYKFYKAESAFIFLVHIACREDSEDIIWIENKLKCILKSILKITGLANLNIKWSVLLILSLKLAS